jgi:4-hydroxy-3-methylbut-2-enyl diphosphate reductase IspH
MNYKIVFNIPNEKFPTEVLITEEQMKAIEPALNSKRVIQINGNYYNTAYFAKSVKDVEANVLEQSKVPQLEKVTQTTEDKNKRQAVNELKEKLFKKNII